MPALVQYKSNVIFSGETFVQVTFDSAVTAGNTLCVYGTMYLGPTISDTLGNTWVLLPSQNGYYCLNCKGGTDTVKFQFASAPGWGTICATEWTRASSGGGPDQFTNSATGTGTTATSGSLTPTVANELAIGFVSGGGNPVAAGGATQVDNTTTDLVEYIVKATTAAFTMTATLPSSTTWYFAVDTFKPLTTQNITATCTDTITLTSTLQRAIGKPISNTFTLVSTIKGAVSRPITNSFSLTSTLTGACAKACNDLLSLSEIRASNLGHTSNDSLSLIETVRRAIQRGLTESISPRLTDTPIASAISKGMSDIVAVSDSMTRSVSKIYLDAIILADGCARLITSSLADGLSLREGLTKNVATAISTIFALTDSTRSTLASWGQVAQHFVAQVFNRLFSAESPKRTFTAVTYNRTWSAPQTMIYADPKNAEASENFKIDWPQASGDAIAASVWELPDGLTAPAQTNSATTASVRLSGGTPGVSYVVKNVVTLTSGQILVQEILLPVN